ncbi:MAG: ATP-binding cassette domain-containing protein [Deltaproteobacteria bacterium]|nr:ATP-binding cassette domain-containing protein [Deltaproteobacteria bacterium]MCB9788911.1 ATP-binding cassette domain-containing protein [Deltaproteobacteria bacterium]
MAELSLEGIEKTLGSTPILRGVDLDARDGELVVLVGASGCGKSTLLRVIAGLETPDRGRVVLDGRDVTALSPRDRDVAMVFQSYALYPHLSVRDNLVFGLRLQKVARGVIDERVAEVSEMLGLGELLGRLPRELSGGQRQRVAMGRAIARRPKLFLFDEPLSNLDAKLRNKVRVEIKALHRKLRTTTIYVTHDQLEAMTLADRLVVLDRGVVQQVGSPLEVFERPANRFVAGFIGTPPMNLLDVEALDPGLRESLPAGCATLGVRAHQLRAVGEGEALSPGQPRFDVEVLAVEPMGAESWVHGVLAAGEGAAAPAVSADAADGAGRRLIWGSPNWQAPVGERMRWTAEPSALHCFGARGERL